MGWIILALLIGFILGTARAMDQIKTMEPSDLFKGIDEEEK